MDRAVLSTGKKEHDGQAVETTILQLEIYRRRKILIPGIIDRYQGFIYDLAGKKGGGKKT